MNIKLSLEKFRILPPSLIGLVLACLTVFLPFSLSFASNRQISEIFIEATGNNKYEAQIKAHELGMKRALVLVANQMQIKKEDVSEVPYQKLKKVFKPVLVYNELHTAEKYSATATYSYVQGEVHGLLLEYGNAAVDDLFYEYLILPVFKQKKVLNIWQEDKRWNNFWQEARGMLDRYKILYPQASPHLKHNITSENILNLEYQDFADILPGSYFKKVMVITAEFFTNRKTRESLIQVNKTILSPGQDQPQTLVEEYPLNIMEDIPHTVELIIDKIIDDYGKIRVIDQDENEGEEMAAKEEQTPIIMNFDVFDQEEMDLVIGKLENIAEIDSFKIEHDYNTRYKILIYTTHSEYELAEGLYLNGLSYKIHGNLYNLIDIKKGS